MFKKDYFCFPYTQKTTNKMVLIRHASENDSKEIIRFQLEMALESEGLALDPRTLAEGVEAVFKDPQKGKYYVAEVEHKIVGSMLITHEWSDWRNQWIYWLQSIYVIPEYRNKGIFQLMYERIRKEVVRDNTVAGIRLYVDTSNDKAIRAYNSAGMDGEHYRVFEWMK
jgi:ribosomal protein S18 acetylase RimI-like enzyme